jgi:hypothetical protein
MRLICYYSANNCINAVNPEKLVLDLTGERVSSQDAGCRIKSGVTIGVFNFRMNWGYAL